ncbi:hypothetical protein K8I61_11840 [bacterium]|nr:hypothetical protein [bacterium]
MSAAYFEFVLTGNEQEIRDLVANARATMGANVAVFISRDVGIHGETRLHKALQMVRLEKAHLHVLVPAAVFDDFRAMAATAAAIDIESAHEVLEQSFKFRFRCYNKEKAHAIARLFNPPPEGVTMRNYEFKQRDDPEAKGQELYTPTHDFEYVGHGEATGELPRLVAMHRRAEEEPLVELSEIHLTLGADVVKND